MGAAEIRNEIRRAEFAVAARHLPPPGRTIDLGAGSGLQTDMLSELTYDVVALDLPGGSYAPGSHMVWFDGVLLPLRTSSVDAIFSSHVLEHVEDLPGLFRELERVLRPNGIGVHVVPTATWRMLGLITRWKPIATAVATRPLPGRSRRRSASSAGADDPGDRGPEGATFEHRSLLTSVLVPLPHGAHHSAVGELFAFSRWGWKRALRRTGWTFDGPHPTGIAYSGTHAGPEPSIATRRRVARLVGSSSAVWLLTPPVRVALDPPPPAAAGVFLRYRADRVAR